MTCAECGAPSRWWREEQYSACEEGHVWSHRSSKRLGPNGGLLRQRLAESGGYKGYLVVGIDSRSRPVHVVVCTAFHGPPGPKQEVRHWDGDPLNNRSQNLLWGTRQENMLDASRHGRLNPQRNGRFVSPNA